MDGFEEIQKKDISALITKLNKSEITKKEFDEEYKKLGSHEYIRSVAPEFCPYQIINMYDKAEKDWNTTKKVVLTTGITTGAGVATALLAMGSYDLMDKKRKKSSSQIQDQKNQLYYKKRDLEQLEAEKID